MISKATTISFKILNRHAFGQVKKLISFNQRMKSGPGTSTVDNRTNLQNICNRWREKLDKYDVPEADLSVKYIIEKVLGQPGGVRKCGMVKEITKEMEEKINDMCTQRLNRKPIQYIIGDWDFRHLTLIMKAPVFIPRPETEDLVDIIRSYHLQTGINHLAPFRFLEVGCGSGAICLSFLSENQQTSCIAIDANSEAVSLTKVNGIRNKVQDRLTVTVADIGSFVCSEQFDAIISNPPYIPSQDMCDLQPEVKSYEDRRALCGGEDGMDVIKNIFYAAPQLLKPNGSIWLEVDLSHPPLIRKWIHDNPSLSLKVKTFYNDFTKSVGKMMTYIERMYNYAIDHEIPSQ